MCRVSFNPCRSWWPTIAEPSPLLVQLPQVVSPPAVEKYPPASEPVRMSCSFGVSPRPFTISPFSVKAVCLSRVLCPECRSSTLFPTTTPLAFCHGPLPMRLRASTPWSPPGKLVLRYARQFVAFAPAALASAAQCASAPSSPPRSAPLPVPVLVTKNVMFACCACARGDTPAPASATDPKIPAAAILENLIWPPSGWVELG